MRNRGWKKGGKGGRKRRRKERLNQERKGVILWGKVKGLRKQECIWVTEHKTTHNRKPRTHNTNRLWVQVKVKPKNHILSMHNNKWVKKTHNLGPSHPGTWVEVYHISLLCGIHELFCLWSYFGQPNVSLVTIVDLCT